MEAWERRSAEWRTMLHAREAGEAAVYGEDGAGDEGGGVGEEEVECAVELGGGAEAAEGRLVEHGLPAGGGGAVGVEEQAAVLIGDEEAGSDGVHAQAVAIFGRELDREPAGEVVHGGFGVGVADDAGDGALGGHGGKVDDVAPLLRGEGLRENLGREDRALEVEGEDLTVGREVEIEERFVGRDGGAGLVAAGGVDEGVDAAETGDDFGADLFEAGAIQDIDGVGGGFTGQADAIGAGGVELGLVAAEEDDAGTLGDEVACGRAGENAGGARHDDDAAGEIEEGRRSRSGHDVEGAVEFKTEPLKFGECRMFRAVRAESGFLQF